MSTEPLPFNLPTEPWEFRDQSACVIERINEYAKTFARTCIAADRALRPSGGREGAMDDHPVDASIQRPAEFGTRIVPWLKVTEFYGAFNNARAEDAGGMRYLLNRDTEHVSFDELCVGSILRHATVSSRNFVLRAFQPSPAASGGSTKQAEANGTHAGLDVHQVSAPVEISSCATCGHPVESGGERPAELSTDECICRGNWRAIVKETEHLIDRKFLDRKHDVWQFFGIVHGADDYYYGMNRKGQLSLLSCVGSIEGHGYQEFVQFTADPPIVYEPPAPLEWDEPTVDSASGSQESGSTECKESSPLSPASKGRG